MKKNFVLLIKAVCLLSLCLLLFTACNRRRNTSQANVIDRDTSYAIGMILANELKSGGFPPLILDYNSFRDGFKSFNEETSSRLSFDVAQELFYNMIMELQSEMQGRMYEEMMLVGEKNLAEGEAFLAENRLKSGVMVTASGLQFEVISQGTGERPGPDDYVLAHYEGSLLSGEIFDSSYDRGEPTEFNLAWLIEGWQEGIQLMNEGGTFIFYIHPDLAYGLEGRGAIPPNSALIFRVELISIIDDIPDAW